MKNTESKNQSQEDLSKTPIPTEPMNAPFNSEDHLVKPHRKISRPVEQKDVERLIKDAKTMLTICRLPVGVIEGGHALAHAQIDDKDPLRFFVLKEGAIVINPVIVRHTAHGELKKEGCLTFPWKHENEWPHVERFYKVDVEYQSLTPEKQLTEVRVMKLKGISAEVMQHEIDHFDAKYVYDEK